VNMGHTHPPPIEEHPGPVSNSIINIQIQRHKI